MDPTANIEEQVRIAARIIAAVDQEDYDVGDVIEEAERLAELVEALDEWIVGGGFLPSRWPGFHRVF